MVIVYIIGVGSLINGADGTLENYVASDVLELVALIAVFVGGLGNVEPTLRIIPLVLQQSLHGDTWAFVDKAASHANKNKHRIFTLPIIGLLFVVIQCVANTILS